MQKEMKYQVCVKCMTYNQCDYIVHTLDGIAMQQTNFPFICTVVDDASTDNNQKVILNYLNVHFDTDNSDVFYKNENDYAIIYFAQHKSNKHCFFSVLLLKNNHYCQKKSYLKDRYISEWRDNSKYVCTCEGDDYWTNPTRLQKMVDFLEEHPDYVVVNHRINRYYQATDELKDDKSNDVFFGKAKGFTYGRYFNRFVHWTTQTIATVYRREILEKSLSEYPYSKTDGILSYFPLKYGKGYCFNDYMATYRINDGGTYSRLSQVEKSYWNWKMFKDFDTYEKSFFSKLSYIEAYSRLLVQTKWKRYKDANFNIGIFLFTVIYVPLKKAITLYYKVRFVLQS